MINLCFRIFICNTWVDFPCRTVSSKCGSVVPQWLKQCLIPNSLQFIFLESYRRHFLFKIPSGNWHSYQSFQITSKDLRTQNIASEKPRYSCWKIHLTLFLAQNTLFSEWWRKQPITILLLRTVIACCSPKPITVCIKFESTVWHPLLHVLHWT